MYVEFEKGMKPQLFDLVRDPGEHVNLYGTPGGDRLVPEMRAMMEALKAGERL
jgi:hypothetical protein